MPVMDGATLIHALQKFNPQLKIISASGSTSEYKTKVKAEAFLTKPFTAEKLLKTLAEYSMRKMIPAENRHNPAPDRGKFRGNARNFPQ